MTHVPCSTSRVVFAVLAALVCAVLLLAAAPAHGADAKAGKGRRTITVSHTYVLGDNDTRREARSLCLLEAKRKIVEQAGTYVESISRADEFVLTTDEVASFAGAMLRTTVKEEKPGVEGSRFTLTLVVEAVIDEGSLKAALERYARDASLRRELLTRHDAIEGYARRATDASLGVKESAAQNLEARDEALARIRDLEQEQASLLGMNADPGYAAAYLVEKGMPVDRVLDMAGQPAMQRTGSTAGAEFLCMRYGTTWVVFRDRTVACVRTRLESDPETGSDCHCSGFAADFLDR